MGESRLDVGTWLHSTLGLEVLPVEVVMLWERLWVLPELVKLERGFLEPQEQLTP